MIFFFIPVVLCDSKSSTAFCLFVTMSHSNLHSQAGFSRVLLFRDFGLFKDRQLLSEEFFVDR